MSDYQELYRQSLVQIQKQKQQIRKLQQQIRQRCQSYLIHSSRYRSKKHSMGQNNSIAQNQNARSRVDEDSEKQPSLQINQNTVNLTLQNSNIKPQYIDQSTLTVLQNQVNSSQNRSNGYNDSKTSSRVQKSPSDRENAEKLQQSLSNTIQNNIQQQVIRPLVNRATAQPLIQKMLSISSNISSISQPNLMRMQEQTTLPKQERQPTINWEQVVSGLKERISVIQKQKSDQVQKVLSLEQEVRSLKKEQRNLVQNSSGMKKKPTKSIQDAKNVYATQQAKTNQNLQEDLLNLWNAFEGQISFEGCNNLSQKIQQVNKFVKQLKSKLKHYQDQEQKRKKQSMENSQVQEYNFSTPYRKIKKQSKQNSLSRDYYQEQQLQMLRKKCQQLQAELSTLSKGQKNQQINEQQAQNQQQIVNQQPLLIQQQLQKPNGSPYIKRSFVRKKLVKRNLSALILRTPSKSKEESKASMMSQLQKLKSHLMKSKNGQNDNQVLSLSRKIQKLENRIEKKEEKEQKERIDQMSDQNSSIARASGVSQDNFTQIIQIQTEGPGFKNYTAHILGLNKKDKSTHQKIRK